MDDIIKILMDLMQSKPKPKGGITNSSEAAEFLGKQLSKEQKGNLTVLFLKKNHLV